MLLRLEFWLFVLAVFVLAYVGWHVSGAEGALFYAP